jgi:hypothetical protein
MKAGEKAHRCYLCRYAIVEPTPWAHKTKRGHWPMVVVDGETKTITASVDMPPNLQA